VADLDNESDGDDNSGRDLSFLSDYFLSDSFESTWAVPVFLLLDTELLGTD